MEIHESAVPAAAAQVLLLNALQYTDCELAVDKGWNYLLGNLVASINLFLLQHICAVIAVMQQIAAFLCC